MIVLLLMLLADPATEAQIGALRASESHLGVERAVLQRRLEQQARTIDELKAAGGGAVNEARLRTLMAQAQELARELQSVERALAAKRRQTLAAVDQRLSSVRDETERTRLMQLRAEIATALATPRTGRSVTGALGVAESASDGPEELQEKADLLKDAEDKIRRELAALDRRYQAAKRRGELLRSVRSLDSDLFGEDVRRQRIAPSRSSDRATAAEAPNRSRDEAAAAFDRAPAAGAPGSLPTSGGSQSPSSGGATASPTPTPPPQLSPPMTSGVPGTQPLSDVLVLKDLLDPTTVSDLSQPKDSPAYLRGLERARQKLQSIAEELDRRSGLLRKRADELLQRRP